MNLLPTQLSDSRKFIDSIDLRSIEASVMAEAQAQIVIVGPVNSGKSTLFNTLKGQKLSAVSAVPGTTIQAHKESFGPFHLVDTPGFGELGGDERAQRALGALDEATTVILVLDASAGVRQSDGELLDQIRARGLPVVVVLNKIDLIKQDYSAVVRDIERKLRAPIIPISAKKGQGVAEGLIPALIDSDPRMAVTVGRALPKYRKLASRRVIRESSVIALAVGFEPVPLLAIPFLVGIQIRMMLRLAAIYGQPISIARARELITAIAGGLAIRYATQELIRLIPVAGWITAGIVGATGTTALGRTAVVLFENSGNLNPEQLRGLYRKLRRRPNKTSEEELAAETK